MGLNLAWSMIFVCFSLAPDFVLVSVKSEDVENRGSKKPPVKRRPSTPQECARQCREGEPPKVCYYHFTLEAYTVLGGACQLCTPDNTNQLNATCQLGSDM